jgi:hypothetical protein
MAVLGDPDRALVNQGYQSDLSAQREQFGSLTKADIRAAVDAADTWASTNAAAFNTALPVAARNGLTAPQKALLLSMVVQRRWVTGA